MHRIARSLLHLRSLSSTPIPRSAPPNPVPFRPRFASAAARRAFSGGCGGAPADYSNEIDEINLKFAEAREEIDAALDSKETVYFDEEAEIAKEAVKTALDMYDGLLARVGESDGKALQRSMGLKMEQLKAELKQLEES